MFRDKIIISGVGCALLDFLYSTISFNSKSFKKYISKKPGDGGLSPGNLVFSDELENFSNLSYPEIIKDLIGSQPPDAFNVGGPSLVSLIHASQLLGSEDFVVNFYGISGNDDTNGKIHNIVNHTPLHIENYKSTNLGPTPFTIVLSDPDFDNCLGERTFINSLGAASLYSPEDIPDDFFKSQIVCFGGTALVPKIHDDLKKLLARAKNENCITLVNTVFDFKNEKKYPDKPWPLGKDIETFRFIDVLVMDKVEACRISGYNDIEDAANYFCNSGVSSFFITNGANEIYLWSGGKLFKKQDLIKTPVSRKVIEEIQLKPDIKGDTTGCGDNFAGGIIASLGWQLKYYKKGQYDITDAISWGVASGGFACFTTGGTFVEKYLGEKFFKVKDLQIDYLKQIGYVNSLINQKKMVLFGAGKIGRSFIGQIFSRAGFEVIFIDVSEQIINELNTKRAYNIIIKSDEGEETLIIENVRGIHSTHIFEIAYEIAAADIVAVSVGVSGIESVFPALAKGLELRYSKNERKALDIIIAENLRNADEYFRKGLKKYLPEEFPILKMAGLIETSISKMVPLMQNEHLEEDNLQIFAEPYNTLILDKKGFLNPIPDIEFLSPKENIKAWVDRKLFIHNMGHTAAAYVGYMYCPELKYIHEVLSIEKIKNIVLSAMLQSARVLLKIYPDEFSSDEMNDHVSDLILRFQNRVLGDTVFRVGCDLKRKLGKEERFAGIINLAHKYNLPYDKILFPLICGCYFRARGENGQMLRDDIDFAGIYGFSIADILSEACGFGFSLLDRISGEVIIVEKKIEELKLSGIV